MVALRHIKTHICPSSGLKAVKSLPMFTDIMTRGKYMEQIVAEAVFGVRNVFNLQLHV